MMSWAEVKADRDLVAAIDWEMSPALAFEVFQLKSAEAWRHRGLDQAVYFYLSTWRDENRVYLVRRSLKETETLAQAPVPPELIAARVAEAAGQDNPRGQMALGAGIEAWLKAELAAE